MGISGFEVRSRSTSHRGEPVPLSALVSLVLEPSLEGGSQAPIVRASRCGGKEPVQIFSSPLQIAREAPRLSPAAFHAHRMTVNARWPGAHPPCRRRPRSRSGREGASWKKALARAGIEDFRWHDLRHTWASWHIQSGTPLHVLQELGGWNSTTMVIQRNGRPGG